MNRVSVATCMTWKWGPSCPSGSLLVLPSERRHDKVTAREGHYNWVFDWKVLPITSTPLQAKQLIRSTNYSLNILRGLRDAIPGKWLQLWATGDWQLHHNNAPANASCIMQSVLVKHQITHVTQSPHSPFGALWLLAFPKTKITFERKEISDH